MKKLLRNPLVNAVGLSLFSAFYAVIFLVTAHSQAFRDTLGFAQGTSTWAAFSGWLYAGQHATLALVMLALTAATVCLLILRKRAYDEYHTELLIQCLVIALILTMLAIAVFFLLILTDPTGAIEKFMLFISVHWVTVVLADLVYVVITRWR